MTQIKQCFIGSEWQCWIPNHPTSEYSSVLPHHHSELSRATWRGDFFSFCHTQRQHSVHDGIYLPTCNYPTEIHQILLTCCCVFRARLILCVLSLGFLSRTEPEYIFRLNQASFGLENGFQICQFVSAALWTALLSISRSYDTKAIQSQESAVLTLTGRSSSLIQGVLNARYII